jgi:CRP-like cAMP-binding protein
MRVLTLIVARQISRVPLQWQRLALQQNPTLQEVFARYVQATVFQIQQSAACNASHEVEKRLARWLLEVSDRGDTSCLALTHEFLTGMLGANRATISVAAAALQDAGCIAYRRGCVAVLDRARLQSACCECSASVRDHEAILDAR